MAQETLTPGFDKSVADQNGTLKHDNPTGLNEKKRNGRPIKAFVIVGLVLLTLTIAGVLWWLHASQYQSTDNATLIGHVNPISPRVAGTITNVLVNDNQPVKAGDMLAEIDPTDFKLAVQQAQDNVMAARAQAETARHNIAFAQGQEQSQLTQAKGAIGSSKKTIAQSSQAVTEAQADVAAARAALLQQEATVVKSQADYRRYAGANKEAISAQQLDLARTNLKVAQATRDAAKAQLQQAQARLGQAELAVGSNTYKLTQSQGVYEGAQSQQAQVKVAQSQYASAQAAIATAQDALAVAKQNLSYTHVTAPVSGRVGSKSVEVGQRVQAGEPLMSVVEPDYWVVANFKETQLSRMHIGQSVDIEVDTFPDHHFMGKVQSFSPASGAQFALLPPENATGNFTKVVQRIPVKIVLDSKRIPKQYVDRLVPGMSVTVTVHTG